MSRAHTNVCGGIVKDRGASGRFHTWPTRSLTPAIVWGNVAAVAVRRVCRESSQGRRARHALRRPRHRGGGPRARWTSTLVLGDGGSADEILAVAARRRGRALPARARSSTPRCWPGSRCRGIVRYGIGVDTIDLDAARRARHRRRPGVGLRHRGGRLPRGDHRHGAVPPAARGRRRAARRRLGRGRAAAAAPAERARSPASSGTAGSAARRPAYLRGPRLHGRAPTTSTSTSRPRTACGRSPWTSCSRPATSSRCTRRATRRAGRCSTPPSSAG